MSDNLSTMTNAPSVSTASPPLPSPRYLSLTNVHLILPTGDISDATTLHIDSDTGLIVDAVPPSSVLDSRVQVLDLQGGLLSPGMIDMQINGAFGVDLSEFTGEEQYLRDVERMGRGLVQIGVTSYVPTIISQTPDVYRRVLPLLSGLAVQGSPDREVQLEHDIVANPGATVLGWHAEGPFFSPCKVGCHPKANIAKAPEGMNDIEKMYGKDAVAPAIFSEGAVDRDLKHPVRIITLAPEVEGLMPAIGELVGRGVLISLGHTNATTSQALEGVRQGASMITHLYNAMPPLHHREPSIIGLLGLPLENARKGFTRAKLAQRVNSMVPSPILSSPMSPPLSVMGTRVPSPIPEMQEAAGPGTGGGGGNSLLIPDGYTMASPTFLPHPNGFKLNGRRAPTRSSTWTSGLTPSTPPGPPWHQAGGQNGDSPASIERPSFSIIADGVHVHPQAVAMAYHSHPDGCVLVSDAIHMLDPSLPDGVYPWRKGSAIEKKGGAVLLAGTDTLAGSILALDQAVRNLSEFAGLSLSKAIVCASYHPARVLGGWVANDVRLTEGGKADLVLWSSEGEVRGVWKAGKEVWRDLGREV